MDRYENHPVYYRVNKPSDLVRSANMVSSHSFINFYHPAELDFYYGRAFRPIGRAIERIAHCCGIPGTLLVIRLQK